MTILISCHLLSFKKTNKGAEGGSAQPPTKTHVFPTGNYGRSNSSFAVFNRNCVWSKCRRIYSPLFFGFLSSFSKMGWSPPTDWRHLRSYGVLGLGLLCLDLRRQKDSSPVSPCQFLFNHSAWCWCSLWWLSLLRLSIWALHRPHCSRKQDKCFMKSVSTLIC